MDNSKFGSFFNRAILRGIHVATIGDMEQLKAMRTIGGRIRILRDDRGLTQKELARSLGISNEYLSQIELGKKKPNAGHLVALADMLNTSVDFLLLRTDDPSPLGQDDEGQNMTPEADTVAKLVDNLPQYQREECLVVVRALVNSFAAQQAIGDAAAARIRSALAQVKLLTPPSVYREVVDSLQSAGFGVNSMP